MGAFVEEAEVVPGKGRALHGSGGWPPVAHHAMRFAMITAILLAAALPPLSADIVSDDGEYEWFPS